MQGHRDDRMDLCVSILATARESKEPAASLQTLIAACIMWTFSDAESAASREIAGAMTKGDLSIWTICFLCADCTGAVQSKSKRYDLHATCLRSILSMVSYRNGMLKMCLPSSAVSGGSSYGHAAIFRDEL